MGKGAKAGSWAGVICGMKAEMWYLVVGGLFVLVTMVGTLTRRLPLTVPIFYLVAGVVLAPMVLGVAEVDAVGSAGLLERMSDWRTGYR